MQKQKRFRQNGFSLIEMMMVLLVLTIVTGVIFESISSVQKRYRVEESKVDMTQESRSFLDQLVRDLHQAGFPGKRMYAALPADSSYSNAVGLVAVSRTDVWFEGDVDGDGVVDSVRYQLVANASGHCPCTLRRSQAQKVDGTAPDAQGTNWSTEVQNVLNSTGTGNSPWTIDGSSAIGANNTVYSTYKSDPVFRFYDKDGNEVTSMPNDLSSLSAGETTTMLDSIRNVKVTINVMSSTLDPQFKKYPAVSMTGSARILNSKF